VDDELELLGRWREGDQGAGRELFSRHLPGVYQFFRYKVGSDAEDLVQTTFMSCVTARDRFRGQSSFRAYLFGIARNVLYTFLRRLPRDAHVDFEQISIAQLATSPGSRLDRKRETDVIRAALGRIPADQQLLLELHYWHDLDANALREIFEASAGAIRVRLLRARRVLRDELRRSGGDALLGRLTPDDADETPASRT
jgi:RNA polymerase sigma factor (sigma-70 family)